MDQNQIIPMIRNREKQWMQAWMDKDESIFHDILAPDFILASARGQFMTREEWIKGALGPFSCQAFEWKDLRIRVYNQTAVVNALVEQKASVGAQDWSGKFMLTDVWVLNEKKWQVVTRQGPGPL